jgi:hypothetical protein
MVDEPWKGIVSLHEWTHHETERKTRTIKPQYKLPFAAESARMVADAVKAEEAADLLIATPDFHLVKAGKDATTEGTKELLKEARHLVLAYNESLSADAFLALLDRAYFAVHNGDLDSRDNVRPSSVGSKASTTPICCAAWATTRRFRQTPSWPTAAASWFGSGATRASS